MHCQGWSGVFQLLKPIRNKFVQAELGRKELNGLDGELIVGEPNAWDCMRKTNSGVMSFNGEPDFSFHVFDYWNRPGIQYSEATAQINSVKHHRITRVPQTKICQPKELEALEQSVLDDGYEGLMLRRPDGMYKYGRSTLREGYLIKLKRYHQAEAVIVGVTPTPQPQPARAKRARLYPSLSRTGREDGDGSTRRPGC